MKNNKLIKIFTTLFTVSAVAASALFCACVPDHEHTLEFVEGKPATCSQTGVTEHWNCITCGKNFADEDAQTELETVNIAKTQHKYFTDYRFDEEFHYKQCSECGYVDESSKFEHFLRYAADENTHHTVCHCGYESQPEPHDPNDDSAPCKVCNYGGLLYELSEDGSYYICNGASDAYKEHLTELSIPDEYFGIPVKEIGERAFRDCTLLEKVSLGKNVISLGAYAFQNCQSLAEITLNEGLLEISSSAFIDCRKLEQITLPSTLISLKNAAFKGCKALTSIELPAGVTAVEAQTFYGCTNLGTVKLHNGVKKIETAAFSGTAITELVLPDGLTEVPMTMCLSCTSLKSVTIPSSVTKINGAAFSGCSKLETIIFKGTESEWNEIEFSSFPQAWDFNAGKDNADGYKVVFTG